MLRFIPLITIMESQLLIERSVKYFLVQGLASILFIFSVIVSLLTSQDVLLLAYVRIIVKLGSAPFHRWFINLIGLVSTKTLFFLSTVQKIGPLLIFSRFNKKFLVIELLALTVLFRLRSGIISIRFSKVLAVSRLINLSWIIIRVIRGLPPFFMFFRVYRILLYISILRYRFLNLGNLLRGGLGILWIRCFFLFSFLSLGGIPPFAGFIRKVLIVKERLNIISLPLLFIIVTRSVLILRIYLRFVFCRLRRPSARFIKINVSLNKFVLISLTVFIFPVILILFFNWSFLSMPLLMVRRIIFPIN